MLIYVTMHNEQNNLKKMKIGSSPVDVHRPRFLYDGTSPTAVNIAAIRIELYEH